MEKFVEEKILKYGSIEDYAEKLTNDEEEFKEYTEFVEKISNPILSTIFVLVALLLMNYKKLDDLEK